MRSILPLAVLIVPTSFIICGRSEAQITHQTAGLSIRCTVLFDSREVTESALRNCLEGLDKDIVAAVSLTVRSRVIKRLAPALRRGEERRNALRDELTRHLPNVPITDSIEARGGITDSVEITVVLKDGRERGRTVASLSDAVAVEPRRPDDSASVVASSTPRQPTMLVLTSLGRATYAGERFRAVGVGALWTPSIASAARFELGARGGVLAADASRDLYSASALIGAGLRSGPVTVSVRGAAGLLSTETNDRTADFGAEGALSFDAGALVLGITYGRTAETTQTSVNVGMQM